ncbi:hypothetical protein [Streptomyces sp. E5N91]|uniref:hypothetical protein n=1 Tax=Streptomyces sp. E5N91 TaxID=1851996 RepID=UPI001EE7F181|nr:hypothetical protein [Streptomyces sp. E5N91]
MDRALDDRDRSVEHGRSPRGTDELPAREHTALSQASDGSITATSYCLVLTVHADVKAPQFGPSCLVHDVLVRGADGELLLRSRHVTHDHVFPA